MRVHLRWHYIGEVHRVWRVLCGSAKDLHREIIQVVSQAGKRHSVRKYAWWVSDARVQADLDTPLLLISEHTVIS